MGSEWKKVQLDEIATISSGKRPAKVSKQPTEECTVPVIGGGGVSGYTDRALFEEGVLITGRVGTLGKLFAPSYPCWPSDNTLVIHISGANVDGTYLRYAVELSIPQVASMNRGAANPLITQGDIGRLNIPLPPLPEQRAIAHILGTLDDKIELNRQINRTLEAMAQALFKSWFIDFDPVVVNALRAGNPIPNKFTQRACLCRSFGRQAAHYRDNPDALRLPEDLLRQFPDRFQDSELGPIPEGWDVQSLDDIATFLNGLACQKYPAAPGVPSLPVIKIRELRQGISGNTDRATTNVPEKYIVHDGDVLFSWSGSLLIDIWTQGKGVLNQHVFKVSSENYPKWFYFHWVDFHLLEFQRIAADKATTMGHIKRHHLADAKVVVPDSDIMKLASVHVSPIFDNKIENAIQARSLAKLRDTLLPKLISGELRVPDAEKILEDVE